MKKLPDIIKEIALLGIKDGIKIPKQTSFSFCISLAASAWNESLGLPDNHNQILGIIKQIELDDPDLWIQMKSKDWKRIYNNMLNYKNIHFKDDSREIVHFGFIDGKLRIEWK
jgi:hypothetical protein